MGGHWPLKVLSGIIFNVFFWSQKYIRCTELYCESLNFIIHLVVDWIWANCLNLESESGIMNFIWWRIQVDWIARVSLSNYSPLHFPIVLFKSSLLAFPKFSSTYLLGFCSNGLLLCLGFNKYLKFWKISNDLKLWLSNVRRNARFVSVLMHLFLFALYLYLYFM